MKRYAAAGKRLTWLSSHYGVTVPVVERLIAKKKKRARRPRARSRKTAPPSPALEAVAVAG
jgi:hypothetical protein